MLSIIDKINSITVKILIVFIFLEIITLIGLLIYYVNFSNIIFDKLLISSEEYINNISKNLNSYINSKYYLIVSDLSIICKFYESAFSHISDTKVIQNNREKVIKEIKDSNCAIHGGDVPNTQIYHSKIYNFDPNNSNLNFDLLDISKEDLKKFANNYSYNHNVYIDKDRLKVTYFYDDKIKDIELLNDIDLTHLYSFCSIKSLADDIFIKYLTWSRTFNPNINYVFIATETGFFMKYPMFYNSYMNTGWKDIERKDINCKRSIDVYDARCRDFYKQIFSVDNIYKKIVYLSPYLSATGVINSELCLKLGSVGYQSINNTIGKTTVCSSYNFDDINLIIDLSEEINIQEKIMLLYYNENINNKNKISTFYCSSLNVEDFKSIGKLHDIKVNNKIENINDIENINSKYIASYLNDINNPYEEFYLERDDLFEVYFNFFYEDITKIIKYNSISNTSDTINDSQLLNNEESSLSLGNEESNYLSTMNKNEFKEYYKEIYNFYVENFVINFHKLLKNKNAYIENNSDKETELNNECINYKCHLNKFYSVVSYGNSKASINLQTNSTYYYFIPLYLNLDINEDYSLNDNYSNTFYIFIIRFKQVSY